MSLAFFSLGVEIVVLRSLIVSFFPEEMATGQYCIASLAFTVFMATLRIGSFREAKLACRNYRGFQFELIGGSAWSCSA